MPHRIGSADMPDLLCGSIHYGNLSFSGKFVPVLA